MQQTYESALALLNASGFQLETIDGLLSAQQLEMKNSSAISLLNFLSLKNEPIVQELQQDAAFQSLLIHSLQSQELPIPDHWQYQDDFTMVRPKDKKIIQSHVLSGLFYYCNNYAGEHRHPFQSIVRISGNRALLFTLDKPERHLTIDETISSLSDSSAINTFAHVTYQKGENTFRFYFNQQLDLVKTTAVNVENGHKIPVHELEAFHLSTEDYRVGLELLEELTQKHHEKIQSLDFKLTPKFLFVSTPQILEECLELIKEINALKSPIIDRREQILQNIENFDFNASPTRESTDMSMTAAATRIEIQPKDRKSKTKSPSKTKNAASSPAQKIENEIQCWLRAISDEHISIEKAENLFMQMQHIQFNLIEYADRLSAKQKLSLDDKFKQLSNRMLNFLHNAYQANQFSYLDELYESCKEFIDGLLIGLISKFQAHLLENGNESELSNQMGIETLDLIMHFYDKNNLYKVYLEFLPVQYGFNFEIHTAFSLLMNTIVHFNHPNFVRFLIQKNIFKPTDCIGIFQLRYMSLYQFLLIMMKELHPDYISLLEEFQSSNISILEVTGTETLNSLIHSPENVRAQTTLSSKKYKSSHVLNSDVVQISQNLKESTPFSMLDFAQKINFYLPTLPFFGVAKEIMIRNPGLAFIYLAKILDKSDTHRRVFNSDINRFEIMLSKEDAESRTRTLARPYRHSGGVGYLFYPSEDAQPDAIERLRNASEFSERLRQQDYMQVESELPNWLTALYQEIVRSTNDNMKVTCILAIQLYMICLPNWTAEIYQKYCFFTLYRVQCIQESFNNPLRICQEITLLFELMIRNPHPENQQLCLQFISKKLNKIIEQQPHSDYLELRSRLFT